MKRIRLLVNFGGSPTNFRRILPGEYAVDDPQLCGLASFLVESGQAEWVDDAAPEVVIASNVGQLDSDSIPHDDEAEEPADTVAPDSPLDLNAMTVDELEAYAISIGIDLDAIEGSGAGGRVLKADLIAAIEAEG